MKKLGLAIICSMMLLAGCSGSLKGDANAGPNPGGGFYGSPNIEIGRTNPEAGRAGTKQANALRSDQSLGHAGKFG